MTVLNKHHGLPALPVFQLAKGWLLCAFVLGTSMQAHAATPCEPNLQGQPLGPSIEQLRKLQTQCYKHAPYLYTFGQLLNQAGFYDEAVDQLEGALMYRAEHWPTQLEYAIALEGVGDKQSAANLIRALIDNAAVDSFTKQQLQALQARPSPGSPAERRGRFNTVVGHDSNLLSSTYHSQFNLTTPDGLLPVLLDPEQRPRAGNFVRTELGYDGMLSVGDIASWRYSLVGSYRSNPGYKLANYGQLGVLVERSANNQVGPYILGQHQALVRGGTLVLRQTQLGAGVDFALHGLPGFLGLSGYLGECQQRLGLDLQQIAYPTSSLLDGQYAGLTSTTNCPAAGVQAQLRAGQDQPTDSAKPGGPQTQFSARVSKRTPVGNAALTLEAEATHQKDQSGYSLLLANNARRQINRFTVRVEYRWSAGSFSPFIGFEAVRQRSNLNLFEFKNQSITAGVSSRW